MSLEESTRRIKYTRGVAAIAKYHLISKIVHALQFDLTLNEESPWNKGSLFLNLGDLVELEWTGTQKMQFDALLLVDYLHFQTGLGPMPQISMAAEFYEADNMGLFLHGLSEATTDQLWSVLNVRQLDAIWTVIQTGDKSGRWF